MRIELEAPTPPAQPILPSKVALETYYFCVMGPCHAEKEQVAVFSDLHRSKNYPTTITTRHRDHVNGRYHHNNDLYIPIDPFTLVRMGVATWEELGYPEVADAYTKLMSLT